MSVVEKQPSMASVVLDIFSGRPNPSWTVPLVEVERWLTSLPASRRAGADEEGLGYRGLVVTSDKQRVRVFNGAVKIGAATIDTAAIGPATLDDPGRRFETWLLAAGEKVIDPALWKSVHDLLM
jgi:hypothetical protein